MKPPSIYRVSLADTKYGPVTLTVYEGDDYQAAFDKAVDARSIEEWRGQWIKFITPDGDKWALIS